MRFFGGKCISNFYVIEMFCKALVKTDSNAFDKTVKLVTIIISLVAIVLSILIMVLQSQINTHSNNSAYEDQIGLIGYVADNIMATPIKNIYFRDLRCDDSEETVHLFPWIGNNSLNYWDSQLICLERYKSMNYTDPMGKCVAPLTRCGFYCIPISEGTICPIQSLQIQPITPAKSNPDQTLTYNRGLWISRILTTTSSSQTNTQGIYRIEVDVDTFPCENQRRRYLGGLALYLLETDSSTQQCDPYGFDSLNSNRMENIPFKAFLDDNMGKINSQYPSTAIKPTSVAYLTQRLQIPYKWYSCSIIDQSQIMIIQEYGNNIEEIGFIYLIIKSIFCGVIVITLITELIMLKGRIHQDMKILSVLYKMFTVTLMIFFLIEGGLIFHQVNLKIEIEDYYKGFASRGCFQQTPVANIFSNFPELFSSDLILFIQFFVYCMIIIGLLLAVLLVLFFVQLIRWCMVRRRNQYISKGRATKQRETEFQKVSDIVTEPQPIMTDRGDDKGITPAFGMKQSKKY